MSLQSVSISDVASNPNEIQNFVESYNKKIDKVPKILKRLLGSERVNIKISLADGNVYRIGYETKNARIIRIQEDGLLDPTIIVAATQRAIEKIKGSKDPMAEFKKEKDIGNLVISGQNLATKMKLGAALSNDSVLWFFYNILFG